LVAPVGLDDAETLGDGGDHDGAAGLDGEGVEMPPRRGDTSTPRVADSSRSFQIPGHQPPAEALGDVHPVASGRKADSVGTPEAVGDLDHLGTIRLGVVEAASINVTRPGLPEVGEPEATLPIEDD